ncbi:hypothetical protein QR680_001511 [Steinernema hermaphroditum]|uniref:Uncharacterized protein n=1 Tax=Steinernema hermaphroditum TaxID=289476 RepID=A0AA39GZD4_9BILA|nr:hypothetical protein QR680_001511 [Steinernema hermaphroditum]
MYGTVHPAAINYSHVRGLSECGTWKSTDSSTSHSPKTPKSSCSFYACHLTILTAFKGDEMDYASRAQVAEALEQCDEQNMLSMINFITESDGAAAATLENNACKAFSCTKEDLCKVDLDEKVDILIELWDKLSSQIIPTARAMLYPLKTFNSSFDISRCMLTYFRDRVLLKVLSQSRYRNASLQAMLFTVLLETADNSENYHNMQQIASFLMSDEPSPRRHSSYSICSKRSRGGSVSSSWDSGYAEELFPLENMNCARIRKARNSEPCTSLYERRSSLRPNPTKARARTLPTKTVQWEDQLFDESTVVYV